MQPATNAAYEYASLGCERFITSLHVTAIVNKPSHEAAVPCVKL